MQAIMHDSKKERKSRDKVSNQSGMKMINWCMENCLKVANGAINVDTYKYYTYIGNRETVMSYLVVNQEAMEDIYKLDIGEIIESD